MTTEIRNYSTYNPCMSCASSRRLHPSSQSSSEHCPSIIGCQTGLSKGPPMPYHKYEPQSIVENSNY